MWVLLFHITVLSTRFAAGSLPSGSLHGKSGSCLLRSNLEFFDQDVHGLFQPSCGLFTRPGVAAGLAFAEIRGQEGYSLMSEKLNFMPKAPGTITGEIKKKEEFAGELTQLAVLSFLSHCILI